MINKKISIVVPVYKSQECVSTLVNEVHRYLVETDYELILVNDCSPDNSWTEIKNAVLSNERVIGINLRKNSGQDSAIMAGLTKVTGDYVVIMDDDLQHDPADIKILLQQLIKGDFDVCFGNFLSRKHTLWKKIGSWFNGKMAEIIINKPRDIYLSPYKVIKREIVDEIIRFAGPYPYIDGIVLTITKNLTQIAIKHQNRFVGKSSYTVGKSFAVWLKLLTNFSTFPIRISAFIGITTSILGFFLALFYFVRYFIVGESVEGWTSLIIIILILCGTILLSIGIVGEYVGRSFMLLNQHPQYSIKQVLTAKDLSVPRLKSNRIK